MGTEVELKLALAPDAAMRLKRHPLLQGCKPLRRKLLSIYFDTPDFALSRRAVALRLRRVGYRWEQTLKADAENAGALTRRPEWNIQVTGNRPDLNVLPVEARACLGDIQADDLQPCFSTEFTRTAWHLEDEDGALELAYDQGEVRSGALAEVISEVEFELKSGANGQLFKVAVGFLDTLPFTLEPRSKAERGYLLAGALRAGPVRAAPPDLSVGQDAGSAWRTMLASALSQLVVNVPGASAGQDPEYLHQTRVAVRRLRTLLNLARSLSLDESLWEGDLRWLMGELSAARDWDVFATETLPRISKPWSDRTEVQALYGEVEARRASASARASAALTSARFVRLILEAEESMVEAPSLHRAVEDWAAEVLERRLKQLKRHGRDFARLDAAGRHALRIAAKRLRYSVEAFSALRNKRARAYLRELARLQDVLGAANDQAVAQQLLSELVDSPHAYAAGLLEGYMTGAATDGFPGLKRAYEKFIALKPFWR
jgi:triphosphatase